MFVPPYAYTTTPQQSPETTLQSKETIKTQICEYNKKSIQTSINVALKNFPEDIPKEIIIIITDFAFTGSDYLITTGDVNTPCTNCCTIL